MFWDISKITYNLQKLQEKVKSQIHVYFFPSYYFFQPQYQLIIWEYE